VTLMSLLLDENLSESVAASISSEFAGAEHVRRELGTGASDQQVWDFAKARGHVLVTLDQDFERLSVARGAPPKVIVIDTHNARNSEIAALLLGRAALIRSFESDPEAAILVLRLQS
jgi:predicted nuclease of predicted toxin-antitoxin system